MSRTTVPRVISKLERLPVATGLADAAGNSWASDGSEVPYALAYRSLPMPSVSFVMRIDSPADAVPASARMASIVSGMTIAWLSTM